MPETIRNLGNGPKWHWQDMEKDLREQGGLASVQMSDTSGSPLYRGHLGHIGFTVSWQKDNYLSLCMDRLSQSLVDAFTAVLGYSPFCRYQKDDLVIVDWLAHPSPGFFELLERGGFFPNLVRL